jgi:hypothetical protein
LTADSSASPNISRAGYASCSGHNNAQATSQTGISSKTSVLRRHQQRTADVESIGLAGGGTPPSPPFLPFL